MFCIKYMVTKKYVFLLIIFNKNKKSYILYQAYVFKSKYNWYNLSFLLKEFFYDSGLLKWKN